MVQRYSSVGDRYLFLDFDFSIYDTKSSGVSDKMLGLKKVMTDGRVFRLAKAGTTALVAGNLQQAPAEVTNHQNMAVAAAAAANTYSVTVTLGATAATANQYAEGYLVINDETGEGHCYKVKSHPAASASASLVLTLYDPIVVALTTSSEASLLPNPYNGTVVMPTTKSGQCVGVAPVAVTASNYYWVQTRGMASVLNAGDLTVGARCVPGTTAGAVIDEPETSATHPVVGIAAMTGANGENRAVFLCLE